MDVIFGLNNIHIKKNTIITVGTFDGVHLGHQKIIGRLVELSQKYRLVPTLITFEPHPKLVLTKNSKESIHILTGLEERLELVNKLGLSKVIIIKFTKKLSQMNYQDFLTDILLNKCKAKCIVMGHDHAFGSKREGTFHELKQHHLIDGFKLVQVSSVKIKGNTISSSLIRKLIQEGNIELANRMLGRPFSIAGTVVKGEGRGLLLSFPTANIKIDDNKKLIPKEGVYAVGCIINNTNYPGMVNIGYKPTFGLYKKSIEVHIFDFSQDIYHKKIKINFLKRLRDEKKFSNQQELINQLVIDKKKSYL